jgi:hypothetical protein
MAFSSNGDSKTVIRVENGAEILPFSDASLHVHVALVALTRRTHHSSTLQIEAPLILFKINVHLEIWWSEMLPCKHMINSCEKNCDFQFPAPNGLIV